MKTKNKFSKSAALARIDNLLSRPSLGSGQAASLVGRWRQLLAYLDDPEAAKRLPIDEITRVELNDTREAIVSAFFRWDAAFFSDIAIAMRQADRVKPIDWQAIAIEQAILAGLTSPTEIAERLTADRPRANLDSTRKQVARYLSRISPDK